MVKDKNAKYREKSRAREKAAAARAISIGNCRFHVTEKARPGTTLCEHCLKLRQDRKKELKRNGFCPSHSQQKVLPGKTICAKCLEYSRKINTLRQEAGYCVNHPQRILENSKRHCQECMESAKWKRVKSQYGISKEEYIEECKKRNFACDICKIKCQMLGSHCNISKMFQIDHCHKTGKVRGFLCHACNIFIGHMKEDASRLMIFANNVFNYLKENK